MIFGMPSSARSAPHCGHLSRSGANCVPHPAHSASTAAPYFRTTTGDTDWLAEVVTAP
jgi:hypothetical protein